MAESALQRLLRLKKEKENGNSSLETVQGQSSESGIQSPDVGEGNDPTSGGELLPQEETKTSGEVVESSSSNNVSDDGVGDVGLVAEVVAEVIPQKPMSAMDRLRALKSGGSSNGSSNNSSGSSSGTGSTPVRADPVPEPKVLKERKTHPIAMEMAELEAALDAQVPGFVSILSQIHKKLRADPDVVTLLDDEEIGVIVAGLEKHTNVTIVAPSAIKAAKSKAKKEPVSAMDL